MIQLYDGGGRAAIFAAGVADGLEAANAPKPEVLIANSAGLYSLLSIGTGGGGKGLKVFEEFVRRGTLRKSKIFRTVFSTFLYRICSIPSRCEDMVADVPTVL